jgi:hypothetical protein
MIDAWWPECGRDHAHGWSYGKTETLDRVWYKRPHCGPRSAHRPGGYYVGLDPMYDRENRAALRRVGVAVTD